MKFNELKKADLIKLKRLLRGGARFYSAVRFVWPKHHPAAVVTALRVKYDRISFPRVRDCILSDESI